MLKLVAGPNPNPTSLYVELAGPADGLRISTYTQALIRVNDGVIAGSFTAGWNRVPLPNSWSQGLAYGVYFMTVLPQRGGLVGLAGAPATLYLAGK